MAISHLPLLFGFDCSRPAKVRPRPVIQPAGNLAESSRRRYVHFHVQQKSAWSGLTSKMSGVSWM